MFLYIYRERERVWEYICAMGEKNCVLVVAISILFALMGRSMAKEAVTICMEGCMPICMKLDGATQNSCTNGCSLGCHQILGKGQRQHRLQLV